MQYNRIPEPVLKKAVFIEQNPQAPQHYRPYESNFNTAISTELQNLADRLNNTQSGSAINVNSVRTAATQMFRPADAPMGALDIPEGWNSKRFSVSLQFETQMAGGVLREILMGYTSHADISHSGLLDPNMFLFFDGYLDFQFSTLPGMGSQLRPTINTNSKILNPVSINGSGRTNGFGLRPSDTLSALGTSFEHMSVNNLMDKRNRLLTGSLTSSVDNNLPSHYLNKILTGYNAARFTEDSNYGLETQVYSQACDGASDVSQSGIGILRYFNDHYNYLNTGALKVGDLLTSWPDNNDGIYTVIPIQHGHMVDLSNVSDDWGTASIEATMAFQLSHVVPSICSRFGIAAHTFSATNMVAGFNSGPTITTLNLAPIFEGLDNPAAIQAMETTLLTEILAIVMRDNQAVFDINIDYSTISTMTIEIALNGGQRRRYSIPTFCSSMTAPVVGVNHNQLDKMAGDVGLALDATFNPVEQFQSHQMNYNGFQ